MRGSGVERGLTGSAPRRAWTRRGHSRSSLVAPTSPRVAHVALEEPRVIQRVGIPAARAAVAAVAAFGVTAPGGGVAALGLGLRAAIAAVRLRPPAEAGVHRQLRRALLLLDLRAGVGVAVALLGVAGVGVPAETAVGLGVAPGGGVVALLDAGLVALVRARAVLRAALGLVLLLDERVVRRVAITTDGLGVAAVTAVGAPLFADVSPPLASASDLDSSSS
jgi:hypothetical protein